MTAGGKAFGMTRGCAGLADLVEMGEEWEDWLAFSSLIDQGFAAAEGCAGEAEEAEDEVGGFGDVSLAVGLLLGPAGSGDEEHFGVGSDGLFILFRGADAGDGGAECGEFDRDLGDGGLRGVGSGERCVGASVEEKEPRASVAGEDGLDALAIEPAGGFESACTADGPDVQICDVRVDEAVEAMGDCGGDSGETGAAGGEDDGGCRGAAEGFAGGGVGGVAGLGEGFAGDGQYGAWQTFGEVGCVGGDDADGEGSA